MSSQRPWAVVLWESLPSRWVGDESPTPPLPSLSSFLLFRTGLVGMGSHRALCLEGLMLLCCHLEILNNF